MPERLHKLLARAGLGSRRAIERWISEGRVTVNGQPAGIGASADSLDEIRVDGRPVQARLLEAPKSRVILYHKPEGEVTTRNDPEGRATVFERLPRLTHGRWISIGRLDLNTLGLILFTTDGTLAARLMHPSRAIEREYAVRVRGELDRALQQQLLDGVVLDDGPAHFDAIADAGGAGSNHWYHVILREGRNREVRRLFEALGRTVSRLIRVRYGNVALPRSLTEGHWREIEGDDLKALYAAVELSPPTEPAPEKKPRRQAPGKGTLRMKTPQAPRVRQSSGPRKPRPGRSR
jgi:23S rRNA pseudouridine2605 synthase